MWRIGDTGISVWQLTREGDGSWLLGGFDDATNQWLIDQQLIDGRFRTLRDAVRAANAVMSVVPPPPGPRRARLRAVRAGLHRTSDGAFDVRRRVPRRSTDRRWVVVRTADGRTAQAGSLREAARLIADATVFN